MVMLGAAAKACAAACWGMGLGGRRGMLQLPARLRLGVVGVGVAAWAGGALALRAEDGGRGQAASRGQRARTYRLQTPDSDEERRGDENIWAEGAVPQGT